jgi:hypothetical protein
MIEPIRVLIQPEMLTGLAKARMRVERGEAKEVSVNNLAYQASVQSALPFLACLVPDAVAVEEDGNHPWLVALGNFAIQSKDSQWDDVAEQHVSEKLAVYLNGVQSAKDAERRMAR